jgi:serine/threonine-protein kinase
VVWEAQDTSLGRMVAVKLLHGGAAEHPAGREQLQREALALAKLSHPRITTVFDYVEEVVDGDESGEVQPVLVTELLHGQTLEERLAAGPLTEADARRACGQLAEALAAAHAAGIVHRDLKPGNVMLVRDGVKLLDFGIAQTAADTDTTSGDGTAGLAVGTPACMAPEQLTGEGAVPASDVYALGCVFYWCLTGHAPYSAATVDQVVDGHLRGVPPHLVIPGLPPQAVGLYRQCLAKDPSQRPSAETVAAVLQQQASATPRASQTLIMPAYEAPPPSAYAASSPSTPHGSPYDAPYPPHERTLTDAAPVPRRQSRAVLVVGAVAIAALAAGATALAMKGTKGTPTPTGASVSQSATPPGGSPSTPGSPTDSTPTGSASSTPAPPAGTPTDPGGDPIAYLEAMRSQISGYIAGNNLNPAAGQDIQNAVSDLEHSVQAAQQNGFNSKKLRDVKSKSDKLKQRIADAADQQEIDPGAADTLTGETDQLYAAVSVKQGGG